MKQIFHLSKSRYQSIIPMVVLAFFLTPVLTLAIDDDVPFFAGQTGSPNVMIIFDNSNSMQESPYKKSDGNIYKPGTWTETKWGRGVVVNDDCNGDGTADDPCISGYNDDIHKTVDEFGNQILELELPGENPPNLPGLYSAVSEVTDTTQGTDCGTNKCDNKIFDSNISWATLNSTIMNHTYRYWKVKITNKDDGTSQYRTLNDYDASGYWELDAPDIEYVTGKHYMYELVVGLPGEVTAVSSSMDEVHDRNFNWKTVVSDVDFDKMYKGQTIDIIAGTNIGETKTITDRNTENGYWIVDSDFTNPCDRSTVYQIVANSALITYLDGRHAKGGDHPASKMYQAKSALKKFLISDKIITTDIDPVTHVSSERYLMNIGFSTFLQTRLPKTKARYYRKIGAVAGVPGVPATTVHHPAQYEYVYKRNSDHSANGYLPNGCVSGTPPATATFTPWWGITYTKGDGDSVDRTWNAGSACSSQTITYKVALTCRPTDSLPGRVLWELKSYRSYSPDARYAGLDPDGNAQWGYTNYTTIRRDGTCAVEGTPPTNYGSWQPVTAGSCAAACIDHAAYDTTVAAIPPIPPKEAYYQLRWRDTWGDLRENTSTNGSYIERNPTPGASYVVTPWTGFSGDSWTHITNPDPEPATGNGDLTLIDTSNAKINVCTRIDNSTGICNRSGNIQPELYDISEFRYPGRTGDTNHPHGWSYKKSQLNPAWLTDWRYHFTTGGYFTNANEHFLWAVPWSGGYPSVWSDAIQKPINGPTPPPPYYFPADSGNEFTNYDGDDQVVFIDLPTYDDTRPRFGDDYAGNNIKRILNYINLSRKRSLSSHSMVYTMAPGNPESLTVSTKEAQTGVGTPLADTLYDALRYFKSYIEQDPLSKGGCRKNYIILLTDGTETAGGIPENAAAALQNLTTTDGESRPVKVYVIGFGLGKTEKITLNKIAAAGAPLNDDGTSAEAYFADNVDQLATILAEDITNDIFGESYSRSKAAITRGGGDAKDGLTLYHGYFDYPTWRGRLEAFDLYTEDKYNVSGQLIERAGDLKQAAPYWANGCSGIIPPSAIGDADAGCTMADTYWDPGSSPDEPTFRRNLFTESLGNRYDFKPSEVATLKPLLNPTPFPEDIDNDGTSGTDNDAKAIINFIHHPGYANAKYEGTRVSDWPLADIYNSGPVVVRAPSSRGCIGTDTNGDGNIDHTDPLEWSWLNMDGYCQFNETYKNRTGMLFMGTNGGMIEAITAGRPQTTIDGVTTAAIDGGRESWGYIPDFVLPKLKEIKNGHRFTMDLDIMAGDVDISDGLTGTWKTMLVAGQRKGGTNYVALDITDTTDPQPMWNFSDANLGKTWSRPTLARIEISGVKTSVLIFGGGYSSSIPNKGNRIYIVKASDGTILKEITVGSSTNNVPSRIRVMRYLTGKLGNVVDYRTNLAKLPDGTVVDYSDRRDFAEVAYFGDTEGNLWKLIGLNSDPAVTWDPQIVKLYQPEVAHKQPVYHMPVVLDIKKGNLVSGVMTGCVARYILTGTGDEHSPTKQKTASGNPLINYFFEVKDTGAVTNTNDETNLQWRLSLGKQFPSDEYGFFLTDDGSARVQKGGADILSSYIFLIDIATFSDATDPWTIDASGHLIDPDGKLAALKGKYLFRIGGIGGALYKEPTHSTLVAASGSYTIVDYSQWLTNGTGEFYDASREGGTVLLTKAEVDSYFYDNAGYWCDGPDPATCTQRTITVDGVSKPVKIISDPGEKMLTTPDGYADQVFFMTYTPVGGCGVGQSYFYGLTASSCELFSGGEGTLINGMGIEAYPGIRKFRHSSQRRDGMGRGIGNFVLGGNTAYINQGGKIKAPPISLGNSVLRYWKQN